MSKPRKQNWDRKFEQFKDLIESLPQFMLYQFNYKLQNAEHPLFETEEEWNTFALKTVEERTHAINAKRIEYLRENFDEKLQKKYGIKFKDDNNADIDLKKLPADILIELNKIN